ncbi:MAG TPA: hypothetical protein VGA37_02910 [Gemmatimonadales bacterium]
MTLTTYQHRKVFKIAATARFCERVVRDACTAHGWRADTIAVRSDTVSALLEVPRAVRARTVVRELRAAAASVIRARAVCDVARRVFATGHWCVVVSDGAKVAAVRKHLRRDGVSTTTPSVSR